MTTLSRIGRRAAFCGLGLLLPVLAYGQAPAAAPSPGDTVYTSMQTALWTSADAVNLKAALPPKTRLLVEAVQDRHLRVQSAYGSGWVSRSALSTGRSVVRRSPPGPERGATAVRPSWRLPLRGRRGSGVTIPRLALRAGRGGRSIVSVVLFNPSSRRTAKSVYLGLALYDRAPDSTAQSVRRRTVQAVGPLAPRTLASYDIQVLGTARRGCVGIRWVRVEYLDGSTVSSAPGRRGRSGQGPPSPRDDCLTTRSARPPADSL
jgi:hypothetical protein